MNFQNLSVIEKPQFYLDIAFSRATKRANQIRSELKGLTQLTKSRRIESEKLTTVRKSLEKKFNQILTSYPSLDQLPPFYNELVRCTLDYGQIKKSLGAVQWALKRIGILYVQYHTKIKKTKDMPSVNKYRTEFYGRVSSVVKQIKAELAYLEEARRVMKDYPRIKTNMPTVIIAGYPNVGKTTLLKALTGSAPDIASYPFTTQKLMLGYAKGVQFIDTPGLLDRPLAKRNKIERQAILALKHLTSLIIFVFDPSESCGYTMAEQKKLLKQVREMLKSKIIIVSSKTDLAQGKPQGLAISGSTKKGLKELWESIRESLPEDQTAA